MLATAGTLYNLVSLRLKSTHLDAIAIITAISLLTVTNNSVVNWQVRAAATTTGGSWVSAGTNSSVEYKLDAASVSGGRIIASGFTSSTTQSSIPVNILREALFKFQLERDGLAGTPYELTLCAVADTINTNIHASMDWDEVTR